MSAKLRLGMIGTGVAARLLYLPAFTALGKKLEIVACVNRTRKKAEAYARLAGIPRVVDTAEELIQLPEVDAVLISLPIDIQPEYVKKALAAGKPVLSEKPMAPSVAEGRKLVKAAARYDVPWLVGENFAFMPAIARLKEWLEAGRLGEPRLIQATQMSWMDRRNPFFATAWRQRPQHVGGFITDAGVHIAHAVRRLFGMPEVVKNLTAQFDPALLPIDTAVAVLRFPSGVIGTWTSCFSAHHQGPMLRVYGSKGTAELGWNSATFRSARGKETVFRTEVDSFQAQFSHFCDVVKKGVPVAYGPADALLDLTLIDAIVR
jgi:predicted dehydrogenase